MSTDEVVQALEATLQGRPPTGARRVLARFAGQPGAAVAVDRQAITTFLSPRWDDVRELLASPDSGVRHATAWILGHSGDARAPRLLVWLLAHQQDVFDHDHAFAAAKALGMAGFESFADLALHGSAVVRRHALACLGVSGLGEAVVPVLRRVAARHGLSSALCVAAENLHTVSVLPIVLPGLAEPAPSLRTEALAAVYAGLQDHVENRRRLPVPARRIAAALEGLFRDGRIWRKSDPFSSMLTWSLEGLAMLRAPAGRAIAERILETDPMLLDLAFSVLQRYRRPQRAGRRRRLPRVVALDAPIG